MKNEDKLRHLYRLYDGNLRKARENKKNIISIQKRIKVLENGGKGWTMEELLNDLNMQIRRCEENYWIEPLIHLKSRKEYIEKLIKEKK